ncbi:hypothetical protein HHX38_29120 [Streptomyces sp. PKU-MA01144]|nr:hypothetical protein [Streptomyces sp. PKU-MA01144]
MPLSRLGDPVTAEIQGHAHTYLRAGRIANLDNVRVVGREGEVRGAAFLRPVSGEYRVVFLVVLVFLDGVQQRAPCPDVVGVESVRTVALTKSLSMTISASQ